MDIFQGLAQAGQHIAKAADELGRGLAKGAEEFGKGFAQGGHHHHAADVLANNVRKGAEAAIPGLLKAAGEFGRTSAKGIGESWGGTAQARANLGLQVALHALGAAAEIQGLAGKCASSGCAGAHALRCWLETAIETGEGLPADFKKALDGVSTAVYKFVGENPVPCGVVVTLLALAVMALLVPQCISVFGFRSAGPVAGKYTVYGDAICVEKVY